jgi:hypothetical protein
VIQEWIDFFSFQIFYEGLGLGIAHVNEAYPIKQLNKIISSKRITRGKLGYGGAAEDLQAEIDQGYCYHV